MLTSLMEALDGVSLFALPIYIGLALLSLAGVTVILFKYVQFLRLGVGRVRHAEKLINTWLSGKAEEAIREAGKRKSVLSRVLEAVFTGIRSRPQDKEYAAELGRQTALLELAAISSRMRLLEGVVQSAPMLGLLGTVVGMIEAFGTLAASEGAADPALLAGGIYTALATTAAGLVIALVTFFFANALESRIDSERQNIEALVSMAIYGRVGIAGK